MYSYAYRDSQKAKQLLSDTKIASNPCLDCTLCTVNSVKGFDVAQKIKDVCRLKNVPDIFLA